ncbi:Hypothetical predicted protein [Cloeon dipterum]|uniref:Macro domain-containing protein n=1 Tax=Cloeon dipterum TaxID=197152 RepID=A0A8S1EED9_9INSE|nr:Hypothetical predicted protein [Cloeon dipterum]
MAESGLKRRRKDEAQTVTYFPIEEIEKRLRHLERGEKEQVQAEQSQARLPESQHPQSKPTKWQSTDSTPLLNEYFQLRKSAFEASRGKCRIEIIRGDLVTAEEKWKAHVVSGDVRRTKGVAKEFAAEYGPIHVKNGLYPVGSIRPQRKGASTLLNVISKERYFHRISYDPEPFLTNLASAISSLRNFCEEKSIKRLALVRIASKTDRVHWRWTQQRLLEAFKDQDIVLAVYLQVPQRA